jgi:hypothetical protein
MEALRRIEVIDLLLAEALQKIATLEQAIAAEGLSRTEGRGISQGKTITEAQDALLEECAWWEQARKALADARNALEHIGQSEWQRGVLTRGAGA